VRSTGTKDAKSVPKRPLTLRSIQAQHSASCSLHVRWARSVWLVIESRTLSDSKMSCFITWGVVVPLVVIISPLRLSKQRYRYEASAKTDQAWLAYLPFECSTVGHCPTMLGPSTTFWWTDIARTNAVPGTGVMPRTCQAAKQKEH